MSGGHFEYAYRKTDEFADDLEIDIEGNNQNDGYILSAETVSLLRVILQKARELARLQKSAEWLYSGDTGEDSFQKTVKGILGEKL